VANLQSSKKRIRQNQKREQRNVSAKSAIKTAIKRVEEAVAQGDLESARARLSEAFSALDSASTRGIIKKNTASRRKARLAKTINSAQNAA
jgi:small subunit ribosomal protein S20